MQISYTLDVWGGARRNIEFFDAQAENAGFLMAGAQVMIAANVAKAAIEEASLRAQIAATRLVIGIEAERLGLLQLQFANGAVSSTDVLSQETALAQARQRLPVLENLLAQQRDLLTALAGRLPQDEIDETFALSARAIPGKSMGTLSLKRRNGPSWRSFAARRNRGDSVDGRSTPIETWDMAIAALLHDAVEDQGGEPRLSDVRTRFGDRVADIVRSCSDSVVNTAGGHAKEDWRIRKTRYVEHLNTADQETLLVFLSDKIHNARSILRDLRKPEIGAAVWERFNKPKEDTVCYYRELANAFCRLLPGQLANELSEIVEVLETE